jgi:hypothetical protein
MGKEYRNALEPGNGVSDRRALFVECGDGDREVAVRHSPCPLFTMANPRRRDYKEIPPQAAE